MRLINNSDKKVIFKPLERFVLCITNPVENSRIEVIDGDGNQYINVKALNNISFMIGGALGTHNVYYVDCSGKRLDNIKFKVECKTEIIDANGEFGELLSMLHYTMIHWSETNNCLYNGEIYKYFVCWLRDHVHTLKGMKYFYDDIKSAIELYKDSQREDGMIFDNIYSRDDKKSDYWDQRFGYGDFIKVSEDNTLEFKRIPVENDVEYLYIEGIYSTWKATGDNLWMQGMLDSAINAYNYTMSSSYRWSEKYQLLKRGYTIDTWDFQNAYDQAVTGDPMTIDKDRTNFGVMHGDNTGFIAGCRYLAEMLRCSGRKEDAEKYESISKKMKQRLDNLAWNGKFYTHHVPEEDNSIRDFGTDTSKQISLSNAYALNRGLPQSQKEAIIKEYINIKENLPEGAPGEWYTIYPPFEKEYGAHNGKWEYMNGGVISIVAGELAHGAFESGFEKYGVDILKRIYKITKEHDGYLNCCFKGAISQVKQGEFNTVDIVEYANTDTCGIGTADVPGFTGEGENDLHEIPNGYMTFHNIPFNIPNPKLNGRRGCIALKNSLGYGKKTEIKLETKAKSIYLLHTMSGGDIAGNYTLQYEDGTSFTKYITRGKEVEGWWYPSEDKATPKNYAIAWEGKNTVCNRVGVVMYGFNNPSPEKVITKIILEAAKDGNFWAIFGITLSDEGANIESGDISFGIPDNWGAAAVVYSVAEGLAGVVDNDTAFKKVDVSPRWSAAGINSCQATITYPASGGYVSYRYECDQVEKSIKLSITGNANSINLHCLLPEDSNLISSARVNDVEVNYEIRRIRDSLYLDLSFIQNGISNVDILYI